MAHLDVRFPDIPYNPLMQPHPQPWFLPTLWMKGKIGALFGAEKSGKSRLLNWLMVGVYGHGRVLDMTVVSENRPSKILYLAGEELADDVIARMHSYGPLLGMTDQPPVTFKEASGLRLDLPATRFELEKKLADGSYDWLILEPMRRLHNADEDKSTAMAPLHNDLRRWSNHYGVGITIIHHTGKLSEYADKNRIATWGRGTSDLAGLVDTAAFIEEVSRGQGIRTLNLLRAGRFPPVSPLTFYDLGDPIEGGQGFSV